MDQRLTSKRWLLALSALLLLAIVVLLMPPQSFQRQGVGPPAQQVQALPGSHVGPGANASEETHQLQRIAEPPSALAVESLSEGAHRKSGSSPVGSFTPSLTSEISSGSRHLSLDPDYSAGFAEQDYATRKADVRNDAVPQLAVFEEAIGERQSLSEALIHRNAMFDSRIDNSPNNAAVRLTEWRKLLGVQVATPKANESTSPEPNHKADDEDSGNRDEIALDEMFSPMVIAAVPTQEKNMGRTVTDIETVGDAVVAESDDAIVDEEGYWEPIAAGTASPLVLSSGDNAASELSALDGTANHTGEAESRDLPEVSGESLRSQASSQAVDVGVSSGPVSHEWQMRSAVLDSAGASKPLMRPAATPVLLQNDSNQNNSSNAGQNEDEEEKDSEAKKQEQQTQQDPQNEDKKMIGHVAGKFGTCFRSAVSCGLYFGNEFTFLAAEPPGTTRVRVVDTISNQIDEHASEDAFGFGNRLTLGIQSKNIGFRVVYWTYAGGYTGHDAWKDLETTPVFSTTSKVGLETVDIDLMQKYCFLGCDVMTACGVRFAEYQGSEFTTLSSNLQGALETSGSTRSFRSMQGLGPTFFMEFRKTIPWCLGSPSRMPYGMSDPGSTGCFGCCQSDCGSFGACGGCGGCDSCSLGSPCFPWRLYANVRVSALWADTYSESMTESLVATGDGIITQGIARGRDKASLSQDDENSLLATQVQFGVEHRTPIMCNSALWICRLGFEIQSWDTGKHESMSQSYAFLEDPDDEFGGRVETLSRADNRYLDLFGFTFLLGLNY